MSISAAINQPLNQAISKALVDGRIGAYSTIASDFDESSNGLRSADLIGNVDSDLGIIALSFRMDALDVSHTLLSATSQVVEVKVDTQERIQFKLKDTGLVQVVNITGPVEFTVGPWFPILIAWDVSDATSTNNSALVYVNDSESVADVDIPQSIVGNAIGKHSVGANTSEINKMNGCLSELFVHYGATLDITVEANRRRFFGADGKPVFKGADGSIPLGVQPLVYVPDGDPSDNKGSGGNYTITGALTACSSSPTD